MRALRAQGLGDGVGADVGIAVHVAADPGGETQHARQLGAHAVDVLQLALQGLVEHRQHAIQRAGQVVADVVELVLHAGPHRRGLGGLPAGGQRHAHALGVGLALGRRAAGVEFGDQRRHDGLLLLQQRGAHGLGGMGGEHRLDVQAADPLHQLVGLDAALLELAQHVGQRFGLRRGAGQLVVAAAADAMHALGHVDHLEIGGEGARQGLGGLGPSGRTGVRPGR